MELSFLGSFGFKLKNKNITLLIDPLSAKEKADIIVFSGVVPEVILAPAGREKTFVIKMEGEYELGGVGVTTERTGERLMTVVMMDGVNLVHLSDYGGELTEKQLEKMNEADVILVPLNVKEEVFEQLEPYILVLMGYKEGSELEKFIAEKNLENVKRGQDKLKLDPSSLPEETEMVILNG